MVTSKKKKKKRLLTLRASYILSVFGFALVSFLVYFFSFDSRVHVLASEGNYYYTDKQIYDIAGVDMDTRILMMPNFVIENNLTDNSLIQKATVVKSGNKMSFKISEKVIVGYYVKDSKNYLLTINNESIELEEKYLKTIVHFPLLSNFDEKQLKQIAKQFKTNKSVLTREVIEKIAEMVPFQTSYDDNMVKMTMQDGNIVYTSMDSLVMMANYQAMLTELHGQNACLFLDAEHSAIDKVDCSQINKPDEETSEDNKDEENTGETSQEGQTDTSEETPEETTSIYDQATDWVLSDSGLGLEYSTSLDAYRDPNTGLLYRWNEETQSFDQITE